MSLLLTGKEPQEQTLEADSDLDLKIYRTEYLIGKDTSHSFVVAYSLEEATRYVAMRRRNEIIIGEVKSRRLLMSPVTFLLNPKVSEIVNMVTEDFDTASNWVNHMSYFLPDNDELYGRGKSAFNIMHNYLMGKSTLTEVKWAISDLAGEVYMAIPEDKVD